jgi:hypothetical protein
MAARWVSRERCVEATRNMSRAIRDFIDWAFRKYFGLADGGVVLNPKRRQS